ncbi:MAG: hypothetical protein QXF01_02360 [Candidatus Micrarchaeaceae archaeon]
MTASELSLDCPYSSKCRLNPYNRVYLLSSTTEIGDISMSYI